MILFCWITFRIPTYSYSFSKIDQYFIGSEIIDFRSEDSGLSTRCGGPFVRSSFQAADFIEKMETKVRGNI